VTTFLTQMKKDEAELDQLLAAEDHAQLRKYASYLMEPDHERTIILNAHLVAEHLLEGIISTALVNADVWMAEADFRSKLGLTRALGLLNEHQIACCMVLNKARNNIAHSLEPVSEKWKVEMTRLAYGKGSGIKWRGNVPKNLNETLRVLLALISTAWLRARFRVHVLKFREENIERWKDLMTKKAIANLDVFLGKEGPAGEDKLSFEVDLELAREIKGKGRKQNSGK